MISAETGRKVDSISIVTPTYNEEDNVMRCISVVRETLRKEFPGVPYEHIFADNSSTDSTVDLLKSESSKDKSIRVIVNARNVGVERSFYHAIKQSRGQVTIPILCDLQTPPDVIPALVREWKAGHDIVMAVRTSTEQRTLISAFRRFFYWLLNKTSRVRIPAGFMGFGLYDASVVRLFQSHHDELPFFRAIVAEFGPSPAIVEYREARRVAGVSKHRFRSLFETATSVLITYSTLPLYLLIFLGLTCALIGLLAAVTYSVLKITNWSNFDAGAAPTLIVVLIFGAIQFLSLGIVGLYADVILRRVRPPIPLIEKSRINFDS